MQQSEKEALRTLQLNVFLMGSPERPQNPEKTAQEDDQDLCKLENDETTTALEIPASLPHKSRPRNSSVGKEKLIFQDFSS